MMNWKKRKVYRRGNNSYEVIGVCESFDQLKKYIKKELDEGTLPQNIIVTDGDRLTFRLFHEDLLEPGV